jgi:hypothetical protein
MPDEKKDLSYEEFVSLLQQSTALENRRGPRTFSKDDLLKTATELGIDQKAAAELVDLHLARRAAVDLVPRPFDTRIQLKTSPETLSLTIPPLRVTAQSLAPLGFIAFWFAFIAFWTHGALKGNGMFAAFSIPFWAAGLGMTWRFVMPLIQTTRLTLARDAGSFQIRPLGRTRSLRTPELNARIGDYVRYRYQGAGVDRKPARALLLEHGTETLALLDGYSEQEQRWMESELRAWLLGS